DNDIHGAIAKGRKNLIGDRFLPRFGADSRARLSELLAHRGQRVREEAVFGRNLSVQALTKIARERGALTARANRDLDVSATDDSWQDEVAIGRVVGGIDQNAALARSRNQPRSRPSVIHRGQHQEDSV